MNWPPPNMRSDARGAYFERTKVFDDGVSVTGVVVVHIFKRGTESSRHTFRRALYWRGCTEAQALEFGGSVCGQVSIDHAESQGYPYPHAVFHPWEK